MPDSQPPIIHFEHVTKSFKDEPSVLKEVTLDIWPGEFVSIVGPSGVGKSTFLKLIYAEEEPTEGEVFFNGRPISKINRKHLPYFRRNIGTVFQDYKLLPYRTAFENVAYALEVDGTDSETIRVQVPQILEIVGLKNKMLHYPRQLSGGEQQRVALARALIIRPRVIAADEPTGNLDPAATREIIDLLSHINTYGTTILLATHNKNIVDGLNRRVLVMNNQGGITDEARGKYPAIGKQSLSQSARV